MVEMSDESIVEIIDTLESLLDDMPLKARVQLSEIINELNSQLNLEKILKIRDDLESFSNNSNIDSFTRNEIFNILSLFESLI